MSKIGATVVADSTNPQGDRLVSLVVTFPRIILAELNTHRMLSKNSASSRAIPFAKMVEMVHSNPFIPIAWQKEHKGMQGTEYHTEKDNLRSLNLSHLAARDYAVAMAGNATDLGATKQIANRYLEPFMWHTVLITGNVNDEAWLNFFELRCPQYDVSLFSTFRHNDNPSGIYKSRKEILVHFPQWASEDTLFWLRMNKGLAEIHMMALAEAIYDAVQESKSKELRAGEWHIPFGDKIRLNPKDGAILDFPMDMYDFEVDNLHEQFDDDSREDFNEWIEPIRVKISTAMAARTSYTVVGDEKEVSYGKLIEIHDKLISSVPRHNSPMEHCSQVMTEEEREMFTKTTPNGTEYGWCKNYQGFKQYRYILETK